jgi:hypothetical protein
MTISSPVSIRTTITSTSKYIQSSTAHLPRPCITLAISHPHRLLEQCPSLPS